MKVEILGVMVDSITRVEARERVRECLVSDSQHLIVTPNPEFVVRAQGDREFREILNRASIALPDGFGLMIASRIHGKPLKERIPGIDFFLDLAGVFEEEGVGIYFVGGEQGVANKVVKKLKERFPALNVVGAVSEVDANDSIQNEKIIEDIKKKHPKVLIVAFGAPKQEKWINRYLHRFPSVKIAMGVGGAFDYIAGRVPRAPYLVRHIGFEWLFRLFVEPWRWRRIMTATVVFLWIAMKEMINEKRKNQK